MLNELTAKMIEYYSGDPKRIQHFVKVHEFSRLIAENEQLDEKTRFTIETAALVHDIGIKNSEKRFGTCTGKQQEQLGPPEAKRMLSDLSFPADIIERVCYLVGHHHTYTDIDGIDLQILIEADFLVNLYEDGTSADGIVSAYDTIFKTESGKRICCEMFGLK